MDSREKYCVLGGGPSGLVAAKTLLEHGIACEILEREDDVGGTWYYGRPGSSVYASTHLISSKRMTEFSDFPMPKEYPPYPSHEQALAYLRDYARHFGLYEHLRANTTVARIEPLVESTSGIANSPPHSSPLAPSPCLPNGLSNGAPLWRVATTDGSSRTYRGVVIANGHHWDPLWPEAAGEFTGEQLHARDYKTPGVLAGKRVLVVGGGNSGCDIAVEAAQHARAAFLSLRRGYHFLPKFLLGTPIDSGGEWLSRWHVPHAVQRWLTGWLSYVALGPPERYGLPRPDHRLFEAHPIVNSQLLYFVGHGKIHVRPAIERLAGDSVRFVDGREEPIDTIVYATGYRVSFPFADRDLLLDETGRPRLFLNVFHPEYDNLFVAGLVQPNSGIWPIIERQARLVAAFISAQEKYPAQAARFRQLKAGGPNNLAAGRRYLASPRHLLEVPYFSYRRRLEKLTRRLQGGPG